MVAIYHFSVLTKNTDYVNRFYDLCEHPITKIICTMSKWDSIHTTQTYYIQGLIYTKLVLDIDNLNFILPGFNCSKIGEDSLLEMYYQSNAKTIHFLPKPENKYKNFLGKNQDHNSFHH